MIYQCNIQNLGPTCFTLEKERKERGKKEALDAKPNFNKTKKQKYIYIKMGKVFKNLYLLGQNLKLH